MCSVQLESYHQAVCEWCTRVFTCVQNRNILQRCDLKVGWPNWKIHTCVTPKMWESRCWCRWGASNFSRLCLPQTELWRQNVPSLMRAGMLNSPPVDHHNQQHYEAEQSESRHNHQGDNPHHPAHPRVRSPGHVRQDGPVWNETHAHQYTSKTILMNEKKLIYSNMFKVEGEGFL